MLIEKGKIEHSMKTQNPFVATMYHNDHFPAGDGQLGPSIKKSPIKGADFNHKDEWRMYYGDKLPGFPAHPHRGFETITVVIKGTVDHTDGLGSKGRYEEGDVQWMTAGKGLQHAEMFPLRSTDSPNPLELFQIWLSLDSHHRMVEPDYKMLWKEEIPIVTISDDLDLKVRITVIAGEVNGLRAPDPTSDSWAKDRNHYVSIQLIELDPGAAYRIPKSNATMNRSVYFYEGLEMSIENQHFSNHSYAFVTAGDDTFLKNDGSSVSKVLLLEAEPIDEPIIARGPFVMTTMNEIEQAYKDYQETEFGGWPFSSPEIHHGAEQGRFAEYSDGTVEYPKQK